MLRNDPSQYVILDGRTFSHKYQVAALDQLAEELKMPLKIIQCISADETVRKRLEEKVTMGAKHLAGNRTLIISILQSKRALSQFASQSW